MFGASDNTFEFGPFRLEVAEHRLTRDGSPVPLTGKTFDTLTLLVRNHGRLVTKQQLLSFVWPDVTVDESSLTYNISLLRKALGEGRTGQRYIETIPRKGYRFVGEVSDRRQGTSRELRQVREWMVERDAELCSLHKAFDLARSGDPQVVFICGDAGVGKTTLVNAFLGEIADNQEALIARGECLEHKGEAEPYMPVLEALSNLARGGNQGFVRETLRRHAPTWLAQIPWLIESGGEGDGGNLRASGRDRMLREIVEAAISLTTAAPLLMVLEDLQWCDASTLDFVARAARLGRTARLLLVATCRPSDAIRRAHPIHPLISDLAMRLPACHIRLGVLSCEGVIDWLCHRFDRSVADSIGKALHTRTGGNPLFVSALMQDWESTGRLVPGGTMRPIHDLAEFGAIPDNIRGFIEQQVAMLTPEQRDILEAASVLRTHFWPRLLAPVAGRPLETVERECYSIATVGSIIRARGGFEYPDGEFGERFEFCHNLYPEVIYELLPAGRRTLLHQKAGTFLESMFVGDPKPVAADLARHFREGRNWKQAIHYALIGARQALSSAAYRETIVYLEDALSMTQRLGDGDDRDQLELSVQSLLAPALMATRGFSDAEAEKAYRRTLELADGRASDLKFTAAFGLAAMLELRGECSQSQNLLESYLGEQERTSQYVREWRHLLACSTFHQGQFDTALDHARRALAGDSPHEHSELLWEFGENVGVECEGWAALALWFLGYPVNALAHARRALELAGKPEYDYSLGNGCAQVAMVYQLRRDVEESLLYGAKAVEVGRERGMAYRVALGSAIQGWARVRRGDGDGLDQIRSAVAECERIGAILDLPYFLALLAESLACLERLEESRHVLDGALRHVSTASFFYEAELLRLRACVEPKDPESYFRTAVEVTHRQRARSLELRACTSWTEWSQGRPELVEMLSECYAGFTEGFETPDLAYAAQVLARFAPSTRNQAQSARV